MMTTAFFAIWIALAPMDAAVEEPAAATYRSAPPTEPPAAPSPPALAAASEPTPEEDAAVLQAQGLLAESANELGRALELLRRAREASPADPELAFDLARVALLHAGEQKLPADADLEGLLALEPTSAAARMLRAYILGRRGERDTAQLELAHVERLDPGDPHMLAMRAWLAADDERPRFSARFGVRSQYDTNITVTPSDSPSGIAGVRLVADGEATVVPLAAAPWLSVRGIVRYGGHLSKRERLADYDVGTATLEVRGAGTLGPVEVDARLWGADVVVAGFLRQFMQEGAGTATAALALGNLRPGLFATGGMRNFADDAVEAAAFDRDGPFAQAGGLLEWSGRRLALVARAGFQTELSEGEQQSERGAVAVLLGRLAFRTVRLTAGLTYELRDYYRAADRLDHRISPAAAATLPLDETFHATAGYAWTRNLSSAAFDYDRHIFQLGIEGGW